MDKTNDIFLHMNRMILSHVRDVPDIKEKITNTANKVLESMDERTDLDKSIKKCQIARNVAISSQDWINAAIYDATIYLVQERRDNK